MNDLERVQKLEKILLSYAVTIEQQKIIYDKMVNAQPKDYVMALADGLKYGNWPWSTYTRKCWYQHNSIQHCPVCGVIE